MSQTPEGNGSIADVKSQAGAVIDTYDQRVGEPVAKTRTSVSELLGTLAAAHEAVSDIIGQLYAHDDAALDNAARLRAAGEAGNAAAAQMQGIVRGSTNETVQSLPGAMSGAVQPLNGVAELVYSPFDSMGAAATAELLKEKIETLQAHQTTAAGELEASQTAITAASQEARDAISQM